MKVYNAQSNNMMPVTTMILIISNPIHELINWVRELKRFVIKSDIFRNYCMQPIILFSCLKQIAPFYHIDALFF